RRRDDVRAVVLTGAGRSFSAGGDLAMLERLRQSSFAEARAHMLKFYARYLSVLDIEVPTIAAIRGPAIGAGLCVAAACDLVVVADDATLAFNFVGLGLHPGMGATHLVPRKVGAQRASELLFTGRRFKGAEAVQLGLAVESVAAVDVVARAQALAAQIAGNSPTAVRELKQNTGVDRDALFAALEREASAQARSYASADLGEGLAAIREKRAPVFTGR
ncbi:MAG TPA: enoyl-CoA hydratase-related protein, partial [Myxococcota bacterium]